MRLIVAVPYRDIGCRYRRRAWEQTYEHLAPLAPVLTFDDDGELFSRGASLNMAFETTDADIVIACDADLIVPLEALTEAVDLAAAPGLVQPFDRVDYLDRQGRVRWRFKPCETTPLVGGCNVLSRETWERAGGWHPGFRGWGSEDIHFARACENVAPLRRLRAKAVHLYHPKGGRYVAAEAANGDLMRRLTDAL